MVLSIESGIGAGNGSVRIIVDDEVDRADSDMKGSRDSLAFDVELEIDPNLGGACVKMPDENVRGPLSQSSPLSMNHWEIMSLF